MTDSVSSSGPTPPERPGHREPSAPPAPSAPAGHAVPDPDLRASDADRERVAEHLREALAEGRLDMEEFGERLDATYKARTYGELAPITRDLPVPGVVAPPVSLVKEPEPQGMWADRIVGDDRATPQWGVAVLSGFERKGRWTVPRRFNIVAVMGGAQLDLRDADFAAGEVEINVVAVMGGVNVVVPPGVEVVTRGLGIMGGFDSREEGVRGEPGAPRVVITGFAFWGGVGVERKLTREERLELRERRRQDRFDRRQRRADERRRQVEDRLDRRRRILDVHLDALDHLDRRDRWDRRGGARPPYGERRRDVDEDR